MAMPRNRLNGTEDGQTSRYAPCYDAMQTAAVITFTVGHATIAV